MKRSWETLLEERVVAALEGKTIKSVQVYVSGTKFYLGEITLEDGTAVDVGGDRPASVGVPVDGGQTQWVEFTEEEHESIRAGEEAEIDRQDAKEEARAARLQMTCNSQNWSFLAGNPICGQCGCYGKFNYGEGDPNRIDHIRPGDPK
jgi:hypothetical protein